MGPQDEGCREDDRRLCDEEARSLGLRIVPVDPTVLGTMAHETAPVIEQWALDGDARDADFEGLLLRLRRRIGARIRAVFGADGAHDLYVASLSSRTVVYKGMVRSEVLARYIRYKK